MNFDYSSLADFLKSLWRGDTSLSGVLMSILIASLRTSYSGSRRADIIFESLLCGALTLTAASIMVYFGVQQNITVGVGGIIGFIGVKKLSQYLSTYIQKRFLGK
ncbi:phage holin, lambda family [Ewingella sp. S1.OA.A_B6]